MGKLTAGSFLFRTGDILFHPSAVASKLFSTKINVRSLVECKVVAIKPFWKLTTKLSNVNYNIDTNLSDRIKITHDENPSNNRSRVESLDILEDDVTESLIISATGHKNEQTLNISVPLRVDLKVLAEGCATGSISNMENSALIVKAEQHNIKLMNIKSNVVTVESNEHISCCNSIRGDISLKSESGNITANKLQGNTISLSTSEGLISVGDLYAKDLSLVADDGSIRITSIHGDAELQAKGDISAGTAEGKFNAWSEDGNVQVFLTDKVESADIVTNTGNISLAMSEKLGCQIDVEAQEIDDTATASMFKDVHRQHRGPCSRYRAEVNGGGPRISVKALGGMVKLSTSSWLEAVSLFNAKNQ
uniref:protein FAM185A-like n=1 Tax=Styela clava TaxID=7725 RepID=UPI001939DFAE|nr:protein FAM185A-like [Styela clava]